MVSAPALESDTCIFSTDLWYVYFLYPSAPAQIVLHPVDPTDVPIGDTVLLTCVANGDLPLNISWSREGTVLMNDSQRITIYEEEIEEGGITFVQSILQICSAETDDAGSYSCNADNTAGNDTANFELTVSEDGKFLIYLCVASM